MMKIIKWNVRGLNGRSKQRTLRNNVMTEDPNIIFLKETKCAGEAEEEVFRRCWQHFLFIYNDSKGAAGGLEILWNLATVIIDQPFSTASTIFAHYRAIGSSKEGVLTNAYGPQNNQKKDLFLHSLSFLCGLIGQ
jgi:exonuclease III